MSGSLQNGDMLTCALGQDLLSMHLIPTLSFEDLLRLGATNRHLSAAVKSNSAFHKKRYAHTFSDDALAPPAPTWRDAERLRREASCLVTSVQPSKAGAAALGDELADEPFRSCVLVSDWLVKLSLEGEVLAQSLASGAQVTLWGALNAPMRQLWPGNRTHCLGVDANNVVYKLEVPTFSVVPYYQWPQGQHILQACIVDDHVVLLIEKVGIVAFREDFSAKFRATGHWVVRNTDNAVSMTATRSGVLFIDEAGKGNLIKVLDGDFEIPAKLKAFNKALGDERLVGLTASSQDHWICGMTSERNVVLFDIEEENAGLHRLENLEPARAFFTGGNGIVLSRDGRLLTVAVDQYSQRWEGAAKPDIKEVTLPGPAFPVQVTFDGAHCAVVSVPVEA